MLPINLVPAVIPTTDHGQAFVRGSVVATAAYKEKPKVRGGRVVVTREGGGAELL